HVHGNGSIGGRTNAGVNKHGNGGLVDDQTQVPGAEDAHAGTDQRGQGHDGDAADVFQHAAQDGVIGTTYHSLQAIPGQGFGGVQCFGHIGEEVVLVAKDFELDEIMSIEQLSGQSQGAYGVNGGVAAGGVGQDGELGRGKVVEQAWLVGILADVGPADCHCN